MQGEKGFCLHTALSLAPVLITLGSQLIPNKYNTFFEWTASVLEKIQFHELNTVPAKTVLSSVFICWRSQLRLETVNSACTMKVKLWCYTKSNTKVLSNVTFVFQSLMFFIRFIKRLWKSTRGICFNSFSKLILNNIKISNIISRSW